MKGRVIIWTIVALVVVAGVVFLVSPRTRRPATRPVTLEMVRTDATQTLFQVEKLEKRLADARKLAPAGTDLGPAANEATQQLADVRARLDLLAKATDLKASETALIDVKQLLRKARRNVEVAAKPKASAPGL